MKNVIPVDMWRKIR